MLRATCPQAITGSVLVSSSARIWSACSLLLPHMDSVGLREAQTVGRPGIPNSRQRLASSSCTQRTPAGLPWGMPGIGLEMEGAMQHAPHPLRQEIIAL